MLFYMCILELRAARRVQNDLSDRLAALEQGAAPPAGGAARPNQPPAGGPAPFNQPPAGGPAPPIQPPAEGPPPPNQPHEERPSSSQSHEMDDDAGPSPLAALETKFLLMFQQFEGNIHGMLERIELLEAAAISNQRQLHSPPVASSPATFSPSSPPQPSSPTLSPSVPSSSPSLLPKPTSLPNPSFIPTILITPATPNVPAIPLPQPKPATPSKTTTPKTIPPPQPRRVTPSVPKTSSSLLAPSTPLPKPLDPLDSFPTKCVAPGTHTSSPSVPTCREPLIGRVVLRPPSPPALQDLGVPQQRGPEVREQSTPPPTSSSAARQATVSVSTGSTPSAEPSPQPFRLRTLMRRRPEAWVVPVTGPRSGAAVVMRTPPPSTETAHVQQPPQQPGPPPPSLLSSSPPPSLHQPQSMPPTAEERSPLPHSLFTVRPAWAHRPLVRRTPPPALPLSHQPEPSSPSRRRSRSSDEDGSQHSPSKRPRGHQ
eukprot:Em0256g4a